MFTHDDQNHELTDINFSHQKLRGRSFRGKNLAGANFSHADIKGADFREANLVNTNFSYAQAGVQTHWAIFSVVCSLILAIVSVFSAWIAAVIFTETIFQSSEPLYDGVPNVENGIPGLIVAIVLGVFCLSSIRQGLVMALLAMAGIGGTIVVILGAVLGLNLGASGLKMVGAGAWRAAAAGIWAIIATVSGAIAVVGATFEVRPKLMSVLKIACGVLAISVAITVFKIANSQPTALIMPALPIAVGVAIADLIFCNGADWEALIIAIKEVAVKNHTERLTINSIENKGDGLIVVKVNVSENADKEKIHQDLQQKYQQQLKILETRYQAELEEKQAQIEIYRQHSADMAEIAKLLAQQGLNYHHLPSRINKLIILTMGEGNFNDGFPLTALVCSDEHPLPMTFTAKLPPAPNILQLYQQWRQIYRSQNWFGRITFDTEDTMTNFSRQELNYYGNQLETSLDNWLNSIQFQPKVTTLSTS